MIKYLISTILISLFFSSCGKIFSDSPPVFMAFENVDYISDFPLSFTLTNKATVDINDVGLRDFRIVDSLLIAGKTSSNGLFEIYRLPDYKILGKYLEGGGGPLEFEQRPSVSQASYLSENDHLVSYLYDFKKGRVMRFNISETLSSGSLDLTEQAGTLPPFLFECLILDQNEYFIKEIDNRDTQQLRYIIQNGNRRSTPILDKLNESAIQEGEDFNILSTNSGYSQLHGKIVEAPIGLNNINIYSLDGGLAKTICLGEELSDITEIQSRFRFNRNYTFSSLSLFKEFFGVVFINEDEKTYQIRRMKMPSILLFDYEGRPVAKIQTEGHFTDFDIDFNGKELYTFDVHSDEFVKYDINEILVNLKTSKYAP